MPLVQTRGAASAQGFGEFAQPAAPIYIEDVFSTYLYAGGTTTQTITNGIDLAGKGGMVWIKSRPSTYNHSIFDSARPSNRYLNTNTSDGESGGPTATFLATGFSITANDGFGYESPFGGPYVSWTFRKQPKFYDVVTYTGNGTTQSIAHSLGSTPGFVIIKSSTQTSDWRCFHRSTPTGYFYLNSSDALETISAENVYGNNSTTVAPTSTTITVGSSGAVNGSGQTFVAYVFAHNAGGFGTAGTDNVISCGSYTGTSAVGNDQNLGFEPQWILIKRNTAGRDWELIDNMRGWATNGIDAQLRPNTSGAEVNASNLIDITSTGFNFSASGATSLNTSGVTYIYIAIRRGPMKVPTDPTTVFSPVAYAGAGAGTTYTTGFPVDMTFVKARNAVTVTEAWDRLRGSSLYLLPTTTDAEADFGSQQWLDDRMTSIAWNAGDGAANSVGRNFVTWNFRRAPGFFDVVCYPGPGFSTSVAHNLTVVPQMIIGKFRNSTGQWYVYHEALGDTTEIYLNAGGANSPVTPWVLTSTTFAYNSLQIPGIDYVAYLFATLPGVSKVGSYSGTGSTQTIDCGFTTGARFVLIKRTNDVFGTNNWFVWDTTRGMVNGTDPRLALNNTDAEINNNWVYTTSTGFQVVTNDSQVNASGGFYIFLAIA